MWFENGAKRLLHNCKKQSKLKALPVNFATEMCTILVKKTDISRHIFIPNNTYTLRSAKAFLPAAPRLSKLGDKQVRPRCETQAHRGRQHIIQMEGAACWKQAEQVARFIAACQPGAHLVGLLASIPRWQISISESFMETFVKQLNSRCRHLQMS